jgi:hypothetical protein
MSFQQASCLRQRCRSISTFLSFCFRACIGGQMASLQANRLLIRTETSKLSVCKSTSQRRNSLTSVSDTWFRVLVKSVSPDASSYTWHEMTFCSRWTPQKCIVLCIGVDPTFQNLLQQNVSHMWPGVPPSEPFSLHVPLVQAILDLQDSSIWSIRDVVRAMEKASATAQCTSAMLTLVYRAARCQILGSKTFR